MTAVLTAVPALVVVEIAIPDERLRLLAIGVTTAAAFATTVFLTLPGTGTTQSRLARDATALSFVALGISATLLLRWIPLAGVEWKKELIVLAGVALLLALAKQPTPVSLALALIIGLVPPLPPRR